MNKIVVVIFFFAVAMSEELKIGSLMPKTGHILNDISGKNITLADDLEFNYATNSPTMMVEGMVVGGK